VKDQSKCRVSDIGNIGTFEDIRYRSSLPIWSDMLIINFMTLQSDVSIDNWRTGASQLNHLHMLSFPTPPCFRREGVGVHTRHVHFIRALYHAGQNHLAIEQPWTEW